MLDLILERRKKTVELWITENTRHFKNENDQKEIKNFKICFDHIFNDLKQKLQDAQGDIKVKKKNFLKFYVVLNLFKFNGVRILQIQSYMLSLN